MDGLWQSRSDSAIPLMLRCEIVQFTNKKHTPIYGNSDLSACGNNVKARFMASELWFDEVRRKRWAYGGHIGIAASILRNVGVAGVVANDEVVSRIIYRFWAGTAAKPGPCCNNPISAEPVGWVQKGIPRDCESLPTGVVGSGTLCSREK